jgi:hypothetical protein
VISLRKHALTIVVVAIAVSVAAADAILRMPYHWIKVGH